MYQVIFPKHFHDLKNAVLLSGGHRTLAEARAARKVSEDLVIFTTDAPATRRLVCNPSWLWEEETTASSYAFRAIKHYAKK
jgi:hypothetical protein